MALHTPKKGTIARAAFDAAHARWCGPNPRCGSECRAWEPDAQEFYAIITAVLGHPDVIRANVAPSARRRVSATLRAARLVACRRS